MIDRNTGPLGFLPGSPWFGNGSASRGASGLGAGGGGGNQQAPANFAVSQKVILKSNFAANPGVLVSGRRPDRPGS